MSGCLKGQGRMVNCCVMHVCYCSTLVLGCESESHYTCHYQLLWGTAACAAALCWWLWMEKCEDCIGFNFIFSVSS